MDYDYYLCVLGEKIPHEPLYRDHEDSYAVYWEIHKHRDELPRSIPACIDQIMYIKELDVLQLSSNDGTFELCTRWSMEYAGTPGSGDPRKFVTIHPEEM